MTTTEELIRILEGTSDGEFESDEVFLHNQQGQDDEFNWLAGAPPPPVIDEFDHFTSGISPSLISKASSELEIFEHFINLELIEHMVKCTNQYHQRLVRTLPLKTYSRLHRWSDVTVQDMYIFLSVTMLMTRNSHLSIEEHWSTDPLLCAPIFGKLMTRNRYCMILGMLCFHDLTAAPASTSDLRLTKLELIIQHARRLFKESLVPYKNLCIDESIVPFKGRLVFKQYMPRKRNRFGIKLFVLCDIETGCIVDFIVYCGATTDVADIPDLGKSGSVVVKLLEDYFDCNRCLYVDNWYSSPSLFKYLKNKKTYACGTAKVSRRGMPKFKKIKKGEVDSHYCGSLMALKWKDKKDVIMLSTVHDSKLVPSEKIDRVTRLPKMKPECVIDYSKNMGSVDRTDMMISSLTIMRKTVKWHKKLGFHIFDMHLLNSFFIYNAMSMTKLDLAQFQLNVIRQLISKHKPAADVLTIIPQTSQRQSLDSNPLRLLTAAAVKHMPKLIPDRKCQRCKVCTKNKIRSQTRYYCAECNVYLCVDPCCTVYHEKKDL
nr:piggyBac transposable element-derived protein 4-like [Plodia interpunctella]